MLPKSLPLKLVVALGIVAVGWFTFLNYPEPPNNTVSVLPASLVAAPIAGEPTSALLSLSFDDDPVGGATDNTGTNSSVCSAGHCPTWVADRAGLANHAYSFDGTTGLDVVPETNFDFDRAGSFTLAAWVKRSTAVRYQAIIAKGIAPSAAYAGFIFGLNNPGDKLKLDLIGANNSGRLYAESTTNISDGAWHHVAAVYNGNGTASGIKLYVDGRPNTSTANQVSTLTASFLTNFPLQVGRSQDPGDFWNGQIDEVRVFNRALSDADIAALAGTAPPPTQTCGNGVIEGTEQCDATNLGGQTCTTRGFTGGTLTCTSTCTFNTSQCTNPTPDTQAPTVPTNLTANAVSSSQINLTWTASTDAVGVTGYKIFRGGTQIATSLTNSYQNTGLTANTAYSYQVSAIDAVPNESAKSASVSATTLTAPPQGTMTTASRTSGVAPLAVFFDAVSMNPFGAARPFHDLLYAWDFGDPTSGNWATSGKSKNTATGAVAAHVFETPGTYTATLTIKNGTQQQSYTQSITVDNPDTIFAANTVCIARDNLNWNGCPSGASQVTETGDVATRINAQLTAGKRRILLRRGDVWSAAPTISIGVAGPGMIGAFGTGNKPLLENVPSLHVLSLTFASNDWRVVDLSFTSHSPERDRDTGPRNSGGINPVGSHNLVLRTHIFDAAWGWGADSPNTTLNFLFDSVIERTGNHNVYNKETKYAILGNTLRAPTEEQNIRLSKSDKVVVSHNIVENPPSVKSPIKSHSSNVVINDNVLKGGWAEITLGAEYDQTSEQVKNTLIERNMFVGTPIIGTQQGAQVHDAKNVVIRNNIFNDLHAIGISNATYDIADTNPQEDIFVYENTAVSSIAGFDFMRGADSPNTRNIYVRNNLAYGLGFNLPIIVTSSNNLVGQDVFVNRVAGDYHLDPTKQGAIDAGASVPVFDDYAGTLRPQGVAWDIGAYEYPSGGAPSDTTPPIVSISSPANGSTVSGTITVSANASDNVGVVGVQFKLDGQNLGAEDATSPYSFNWNTTLTTNSAHTLTATARDTAGLTTTAAPITVTVSNVTADTQAPTVPTNLVATAVSSSQINLVWTASSDNVAVTGYKIFRGGTQIATSPTNSYQNTGLSPATAYTYTVSAYDAVPNNSAQSSAVGATTLAPPDTTPPVISAVATSIISTSTATVIWTTNEPSTSQVDYGFTVSYGQSTILQTALVTHHTQTLTGLSPNTLYHYRVRSKDAVPNEATSIDFTFTTQATLIPDSIPPQIVTDLSVSSTDKKSVVLTWTAPYQDNTAPASGPVASYDLRYVRTTGRITIIDVINWGTAAQASGEPTPALAGQTETYTLVDLTPGKTYSVALKSRDAAGNASALSNVVTFITIVQSATQTTETSESRGGVVATVSDTTAPTPPTTVSIQSADRQAVLNWQNPTAADFVRVLILRSLAPLPALGPTGNPRYLPQAKVVYDGTLPRFTDTNLTNGQLYYYTLYAYDRSGNYVQPVTLTVRPAKGEQTVFSTALTPATRASLILQLRQQLLVLLQKLLALLRGRQI